ncbi:MAG: PEGA domain-containing protein [Bryobacteraceae bacterium]|jgi:hypothetical protein
MHRRAVGLAVVLCCALSSRAQESPVGKVFKAGGKWTYTVSENKLTGALYGIFELKANEALSDGISSGVPNFIIMCGGPAKAPTWINSKLISPIVLGKPSEFAAHAMQQTVVLRADSKFHTHFWNMADDFTTFFVDKGATKELIGSGDARIQFRDASENQQVAVFSPGGISQEMLTKACGKTFAQPTAPSNPALEEVVTNSEAAKGSPAAAVGLANVGHPLSPEEMADLVQKGQASKCAVVTVPPGAEVEIDGNKAGVSPLVFVLLKQGDSPRTITIKMTGYKTFEKKVVPDGKTIPIGLTLEKQ